MDQTPVLPPARYVVWLLSASLISGLVVGMAAGASSSPIIAPLLSGLFGVIGASGALWISKAKEPMALSVEDKVTLAKGVCVFGVSLFVGFATGAEIRAGIVSRAFAEKPLSIPTYCEAKKLTLTPEDLTRLMILQRMLLKSGLDGHDVDITIRNACGQVNEWRDKCTIAWSKSTAVIRYGDYVEHISRDLDKSLQEVNKTQQLSEDQQKAMKNLRDALVHFKKAREDFEVDFLRLDKGSPVTEVMQWLKAYAGPIDLEEAPAGPPAPNPPPR